MYNCKRCNRRFSRKWSLKRHIAEIRCKESEKSPQTSESDAKMDESKEGEERWKVIRMRSCGDCRKNFASYKTLWQHRKTSCKILKERRQRIGPILEHFTYKKG